MAKARSKRGAAMVMVIIISVMFTMMSFSLISASSTLYSSANRKWTQLRMEQQANGVGRAFTETLTDDVANDLQTRMNSFLENVNYSSYNLMSSEAQKQAAIHSFSQTESVPNGYGEIIVRLKKIYQNPQWQLDTNLSIVATDTAGLDSYLDSVTNVDYQLTAYITVVSPEDAQALGTAEVTFFRIIRYEAQYYKTSVTPANRIYPDSAWRFFTTSNPSLMNSSTRVTFSANESIIARTPSSTKTIFYQVAEVRR